MTERKQTKIYGVYIRDFYVLNDLHMLNGGNLFETRTEVRQEPVFVVFPVLISLQAEKLREGAGVF
ncbi:hypothetical protein, partial [Vibrio aerogenes]|uniref:hypothetical protein n=1 Tax=Vibrio aerogenes TaxID=92172 RepID=UPI0039F0676A